MLAGAAASRRGTLTLLGIAGIFYWASLFVYVPTLGVYARGFGLSASVVGIILSMFGLWQAVSRLPLGIAADSIGRRKPFILGGFLLAAVGAVVMVHPGGETGLLVGRAITGLAGAAWVPMVVLFSSMFPPEQAVRASALLAIANSVSRLLATAVTGPLNETYGFAAAFYVAAAAALVAFLVTLPVREVALPGNPPSLRLLGRLITRRDIFIPTTMNMIVNYVLWATTFGFLPILAQESLGASSTTISLLTSLNVLLSMIGNLTTAWVAQRFGNLRVIYASFGVVVVGTLLCAASGSLALLYLAQALLGLGAGLIYPLLVGMSIEKVGESERGTAMGLHQSLYSVGIFTGPWLSGLLAEVVGLPIMFVITAVSVGIVISVLGIVLKKTE
jgi:MFS family permease